MKRERADKRPIREFARFLEAIGQPVTGVDRWPDDHAPGEIDAIVGPYAIQHTSIDSLPDGTSADIRFKDVVGELESELAGALGFPLLITWDWGAIQKGPKRSTVNSALREWILKEAPKCADGHHRLTNVPGVPFAFDVRKGGPIKFDGVRFSRYEPNDDTLSVRLRDQLAGRHKKFAALDRYRTEGKTTLLLLQSGDVALMSAVKMVEALKAAFPTRPPNWMKSGSCTMWRQPRSTFITSARETFGYLTQKRTKLSITALTATPGPSNIGRGNAPPIANRMPRLRRPWRRI